VEEKSSPGKTECRGGVGDVVEIGRNDLGGHPVGVYLGEPKGLISPVTTPIKREEKMGGGGEWGILGGGGRGFEAKEEGVCKGEVIKKEGIGGGRFWEENLELRGDEGSGVEPL